MSASLSLCVENLDKISVAFAIFVFLVVFAKRKYFKQPSGLESLLAITFAASAIPTGLALLIAAFDISVLNKMSGYGVYIAGAGLALVYITGKHIFEEIFG